MKQSKYTTTSQLLLQIANQMRLEQAYTLQTLTHALEDRAFGVCMLIFALPNIIPIPMPGVSAVTAVPLLFFSAQMLLGRSYVWLPAWLGNKLLPIQTLPTMLERAARIVQKIEKFARPRLDLCHGSRARCIAGGIITVLGAIIALPVPLGNLVPAFAVCLICLAIIEHDGLLMLLGILASMLAGVYLYVLLRSYFWVAMTLIEKTFQAH